MLTERASLAVMALAKRSSRPFELDGVCYRWRVVTHGLMGSHVVIAPEQSPCRRVRTWITDGSWIPNGNQITPGHIRELLVTARKRGWSPRGPGPDALVLDHVSPTLESFINVVSQDTPEEAFDYSYARAAVGLTPWPDPDRLVLVLRCKAGHLRTSAMPIERCIEQLDVACQRLHNRMPATLVGVEPRPSIWLTSDGAQLQFGVDGGPRVGSLRILSSGVLGWWEYVADQLRSVATRLRASAEAAAHTG